MSILRIRKDGTVGTGNFNNSCLHFCYLFPLSVSLCNITHSQIKSTFLYEQKVKLITFLFTRCQTGLPTLVQDLLAPPGPFGALPTPGQSLLD